jgi:molybdopterin molybdotransferase
VLVAASVFVVTAPPGCTNAESNQDGDGEAGGGDPPVLPEASVGDREDLGPCPTGMVYIPVDDGPFCIDAREVSQKDYGDFTRSVGDDLPPQPAECEWNELLEPLPAEEAEIRPRGEDFIEGSTVMGAGTPIAAAQLGVLASLGYREVEVHRRPIVAIAGSGDELVDLDQFEEVKAGRRIVASNRYTLDALVRQAGGIPRNLGNAADTPESLRAVLDRSKGADLLVTSAGASVGEFDYTRQVLEAMGADLRFWRVRMRPGAPLGFGTLDGMPWLGLPGNPVSAMVTFELFARPVIRRMLGHSRLHRRPIPVILEEPVSTGAKLTHFLRAIVSVREDGLATARLTGPQGSGILTSMSLANALLVVPDDRNRVEAGERLNALPLSEDAQLSDAFAL